MQLSLPYLINLEIVLSYKITPYLSPGCSSSFNFTMYLNGNERYKTETNIFINIINNTAFFVSITSHQNKSLGCLVYLHCPNNDSYNKCVHSCCLPCNYVTKPFGILQRVIKSQKVCMCI